MKANISGFLLFMVFLTSCGGKKTDVSPFAAMAQLPDTVSLAKKGDAGVSDNGLKPLEADELFDDFIFNYASDSVLQKQRTSFPLPYLNNGKPEKIEREAWKYDRLFARQSYYTLIFDREEDMELVGDTSLQAVQVEWMDLKEPAVKKYFFERISGVWMLEAIDLHQVKREQENDFLVFYERFAADSLFQRRHIATPLRFITLDPDDEFSILETTLNINQWYAFRPQMPEGWLSNICYGQRNEASSNTKILKLNGIGNGYSNVFYFHRVGGEWELYKYEDTSI